jgi:hypothetical protein
VKCRGDGLGHGPAFSLSLRHGVVAFLSNWRESTIRR